jgi:hypothetical protein
MIVVHVSGTPGSGKTTLGQKFLGDSRIAVIDTDELINGADETALLFLRGTGTPEDIHRPYRRGWKKLFRKRLWKAYHQAEDDGKMILLFTGILNHMSPPPGMVMEMPFAMMQKYFLDIPLPQLLRQFYGRFTKDFLNDEEFWTGVAEGRYGIPSSNEYLKDFKQEKTWHFEHGYRLVSTKKMEKKIKRLLM